MQFWGRKVNFVDAYANMLYIMYIKAQWSDSMLELSKPEVDTLLVEKLSNTLVVGTNGSEISSDTWDAKEDDDASELLKCFKQQGDGDKCKAPWHDKGTSANL